MQGHAPNLGDPGAPAEQRHLAEARRMTRRRWLATDVGKNVVRRLAALAERHHDHRSKWLAAGRIGNRGVIAGGIDPTPTTRPAERVAGGAVGAAAREAAGESHRPRRGFLDADAESRLDATATHPIDNALREPIIER